MNGGAQRRLRECHLNTACDELDLVSNRVYQGRVTGAPPRDTSTLVRGVNRGTRGGADGVLSEFFSVNLIPLVIK